MTSSLRTLFFSLALLTLPTLRPVDAASVSLPSGWSLDGEQLVWISSATPLRTGGARYEFRSQGRLLGYPLQQGDTLRLRVSSASALKELSVWAAGRRLDVELQQQRLQPSALPPEPLLLQSTADPAAEGPYQTQRLKYQRSGLRIAGYDAPIEVLAEVTAPVADADLMPLLLFLHGRHSTCFRGGPNGEASSDWPCPQGWRLVPSYSGYRYIADVLASQGYLVVSISANGINGQDGLIADGGASARSQLVRHHLDLWARWNAAGGDPWNGRFRGRLDLDRVVLMGHSRGGEGVERAAIDSNASDSWKIRGLVLIGPTAFGHQVAAGIHTTVILPHCDGDVSDLQGQQYVDIGRDLAIDPALRSSVVAMGTNHNFYNTEWTPGLSKSPAWDDWFDPADEQCGDQRRRRLTPTEQQSVGLAYTAALIDLAAANGTRSLPLLDGTRVKPRSIGRANVFVHAIGGNKKLVYAAATSASAASAPVAASNCRGYFSAGPFDLRAGCAMDLQFEVQPHWAPMAFEETAPPPKALDVQWNGAGGNVRIPVGRSLSGAEALDFRIAGVPGAADVAVDVFVRDASGQWAQLTTQPLRVSSYFGPNPLGKVIARELRASLRGVRIDLGSVDAIEVRPRSARGRFWLLDVSAKYSDLAFPEPIYLPRVSVGDIAVSEGDRGRVRLNVPVTIEGTVTRRARLWVQLTDFLNLDQPNRGFPLVLEPGARSASFPFEYRADQIYSPYPQRTQVTLLALKNANTANYSGSVLVEEDDPAPKLTVAQRNVSVAEGATLEWTFRLSKPMKGNGFWTLEMRSPHGRFNELDSDDVPVSFLESRGIIPPVPAVPLSQLGLFFGLEFEAGQQLATITIPTAPDATAEPREGVVLVLDGFGDPVVPQPIEITGAVTP